MIFKSSELICKCKIDNTYYIECIASNMMSQSDRVLTEYNFCKVGEEEKCLLIAPMYHKQDLISDGYNTLAQTAFQLLNEYVFWDELIHEYFQDKKEFELFKQKYKPEKLKRELL